MNASDTTTFISLIVEIAALIISGLSAFFSFKQVKAAENQNAISKDSLKNSEEQTNIMRKNSEIPYVSPWRIEHVRGDTYVLINDGTNIEYDVHIEPPQPSISEGSFDFEKFRPRSSESFMITLAMGATHDLIVSWRHDPNKQDRQEWHTVLPTHD